MAYIDFSADPRVAAAAPRHDAVPAAHFSALEWTTIALARKDSLASLRDPSRLSRAMGSLFGRSVQSRLADPTLEMLRRLAVNAWHYGYRLPVSEIKAFLAAGFTVDQLEAVLASVGAARAERPRRGAKADVFVKTASRMETRQAVSLLGAMSGVAIPIGVVAANGAGDVTVGIVAAALTALLLISLLQMFGVLGGR